MMRFTAADAFQPRPLYEVFDPKLWEANYGGGAFFKDKVVLVGPSCAGVARRGRYADEPGHIRPNSSFPSDVSRAQPRVLARRHRGKLASCSSARQGWWRGCWVAFVRKPLVCLGGLVAITAGYLLTARVLYDNTGLLLLTIPVLSALILSGLFSLGFEYFLERLEKLRTRRTLERYVSKNLVKEILENPDSYYSSLRGVRVPVTILFSDLIGFTTLTEKADP
jgi:adenylate cyclase